MKIILFSAADPSDTTAAYEALETLPDVTVEVVRETKVLQGSVILPFIETVDGARYFGTPSIRKFVQHQLGGGARAGI